jgi:hypothetical protein
MADSRCSNRRPIIDRPNRGGDAMRKFLLSLNSIRAARELRAGADREQVGGSYGISPENLERIASTYGNVPEHLLDGIERLIADRERLRRLVSNLMHRQQLS